MIDRELRRQGISSTDIGAIFEVDPWRDPFSVWAAKKGQLPEMKVTPRMRLGKYFEQGIVAYYSDLTGRPVQWCDETMRHQERAWMLCTPDALVCHERRGVDAKLVAWDQRRKWGATADDIPLSIQLQMWWMLAVLDYDAWDVAAFIGEEAPRVYEIERDREAERVMVARAEEFHRRYIVGDEVPPITGGEAASLWLQQAFPTHRRPDLRAATAEEIEKLTEYARLRIAQRTLVDEKARIENEIKLAIADHEGLVWDTGKFTWRKTKDRTVIDWQSIAVGLLSQYVTDPETRGTLLGLHTSTRPGPRRIWFDCEDFAEFSDGAAV